jgi:hypothetical protein
MLATVQRQRICHSGSALHKGQYWKRAGKVGVGGRSEDGRSKERRQTHLEWNTGVWDCYVNKQLHLMMERDIQQDLQEDQTNKHVSHPYRITYSYIRLCKC